MLDFARVQKLHEAAIVAGLPRVLPEGYYIDHWGSTPAGLWHQYGDGREDEVLAQAAVAWWLREWCIEHRGVDAFGDPEVRTDIEYLEWAEEIVANRKARPWAFR